MQKLFRRDCFKHINLHTHTHTHTTHTCTHHTHTHTHTYAHKRHPHTCRHPHTQAYWLCKAEFTHNVKLPCVAAFGQIWLLEAKGNTPGLPLSFTPVFCLMIIIVYTYHALINTLTTHMIHINLIMIFYAHVGHSPTKTIYIKYYTETRTHMHMHTQWL